MDNNVAEMNEVRVVNLSGSIDVSYSSELRTTLKNMVDTGTTGIIINLKDVNFIDSSGLGIFVAIYKMLKPLGGSISLVNPQKTVLRIFDLTGTRKVFQIFDTLDEALKNYTN